MKTIHLANNRGQVLVDDEEYEKLSKYKWHLHTHGYAYAWVDTKRKALMHKLILTNEKQVDHIDGNKLNNKKENLRYCTASENSSNKGLQTNNTSGYKGVCWNKEKRKWQSKIRKNNKHVHLGWYMTAQEAALEYNKKALELFGEFARLNLVQLEFKFDEQGSD